jgi:hypothetical protein
MTGANEKTAAPKSFRFPHPTGFRYCPGERKRERIVRTFPATEGLPIERFRKFQFGEMADLLVLERIEKAGHPYPTRAP